ncbi:MAG: SurA N-terminal domain-containing protein [Planctomycetes bacterium]|nr:SurA N-terminal domain-containing protein [Planctomycetota bacterium]
MAPKPLVTISCSLALLATCVGQGLDPSCTATFKVDGEIRQVSNTEVGLELVRRERYRPRGQEALEHLVHRTLVAKAAKEKGLAPTHEEIEQSVKELSQVLEAQGTDLDGFLERKNLSKEAFERDWIALSIAHEKLVIEAAGLRSRDEVTPDLLTLWLDEAKDREKVVVDASELPPGIVARVGDRQLGEVDLGNLLFANASRNTIEHAVQQIVIRELLTAEAARLEIEVTPKEIDEELARRRALIELDPSFAGVPYEELLKAQGTTVDQMRESPVIRAQVFRRKLVERRFPDDVLDETIAADPDGVMLRHGARRHLHVILARASDPPTEFIPRSFAESFDYVDLVKKTLTTGMSFAEAAKRYSDEPNSKAQGGDIGMHGRTSTTVPTEVLEAACELDPFVVSSPIRTEAGYFLVMVSAIEERPTDATLRERLRTELTQDYLRDLLASASLEMAT